MGKWAYCPSCGGTGKGYGLSADEYGNKGKCIHCNGKGKIPQERLSSPAEQPRGKGSLGTRGC